MNKYPLGGDILVSWSLDLGGQPIDLSGCTFQFEYNTAGGSSAVPSDRYTISEGVLEWTFPGESQHAYGMYGLHLTAFSDGMKVAEFRSKDAFEIIHGTPTDEEQPVPLESSVETEQDPFEPDEPEEVIPEYVSRSPLHVEKVPLGSNIIINWKLLSAEIFDFPLEQCQLDLFYAAAGSGYNRAEDYELKTEDGYVLQWNFAADKQVRFGLYSLFLDIHYNGERIATLVREAAFSLVHRSGSGMLPDRIISFESVVTTLGGGALYALADVVNDGYSTVYRDDGITPAASGDSLIFNGEKWAASDALLIALQNLRSQINAVSGRVDSADLDLAGISSRLDGAISAIEQNTAWIQADEDSIAQLIIDADRILASVTDIYGNIAELQITSSSISTRVSNAEGDISSLQQTAQGFDLRVSNAEGDIGDLYLTADEFGVRISDAEGNISDLEQTSTSLTSRITGAEGDLSVLQQTATSLTSAISNAQGDISVLQQTATGLESRVANAEGDISTISQTAEAIQLQVDNQQGDIATLEVSARGLTSRVSSAEGYISIIDQRADAIELSVSQLSGEQSDYEEYVNGVLEGLQEQIDGAVDTWFYDYAPVHTDAQGVPDSQVPLLYRDVQGVQVPVYPYYDWYMADQSDPDNHERVRNEHVNDIFYDTASGNAYRFVGTGAPGSRVYSWVLIEDSAAIRALQDAARAQDTADHKRRVFLVTPTPPYDAGDLWVKDRTVGNIQVREIYRCITSRAAGSFDAADWGPADDYGYQVNKSNLEILSDAIIGQVTQITYGSDGIITNGSTIEQTANSIKLQVANTAISGSLGSGGAINTSLLNTGIDITNGDITLTANHIKLQNQGAISGLELVTIGTGANQHVVINTGSLNVNGIFSTTPGSVWASQLSNIEGYADNAAGDALDSAKDYADDAAGDAYTNAVAQAATNASEYITINVVPSITAAQTTANNAVTAAGNAQTTANNAQNAVDGLGYLASALVNGTTAIGGGLVLTSLVGLGGNSGTGGAWELWSGMNGQYSASAPGHGVGAWYGGGGDSNGDYIDCITIPNWATMTTAERLTAWDTYRYARSLFRLDGSGYLASGAITWGASGDLHLMDNIYIGAGTSNPFGDYITFLTKLATWFEDVEETIGGVSRRVLRINMNGTAAGGTDFAGLVFNGFLISGGDQIVVSGTPGGGGTGGAGFVYELKDTLAGWTSNTGVSTGQVLMYQAGADSKNGTGTGAWKYGTLAISNISGLQAALDDKLYGTSNKNVTARATDNSNTWGAVGFADGDNTKFNLYSIRFGATPGASYGGSQLAYGSGIMFGGADTRAFIAVRYSSGHVEFGGGSVTSPSHTPTWHFGVEGADGTTYDLATIASNAANGNTAYNSLVNYVTSVDAGDSNHPYNLAITKGSGTSYITAPFATETKRFRSYTAGSSGLDLNTALTGGAVAYNYGSGNYWQNGPSGMTYGGVLQINSGGSSDTLAMQLAWDVAHNVEDGTKNIWWRDRNNLGWGSWKLFYHSGNFNPSNYVLKAGDTMTGPLTITGSTNTLLAADTAHSTASYIRLRYNTGGTAVTGYIGLSNGKLVYYSGGDREIWHAGNSNGSSYQWACSTLTVPDIDNAKLKNGIISATDTGTIGFIGGAPALLNNGGVFYIGNRAWNSYTWCKLTYARQSDASSSLEIASAEAANGQVLSVNVLGTASIYSPNNPCFVIKRKNSSGSASILMLPDNQDTYGWLLTAARDYGTSKAFTLAYRNSTDTEVLRVATNGNVGIGTASPNGRLHVTNTADWGGVFSSSNNCAFISHANANSGALYLGTTASTSDGYLLRAMVGQTSLGSGGTAALVVRADGNVGIGTASPGYKLDVNGVARCQFVYFLDTAGTGNAGYVGRGGNASNNLQFTAASGNALGLGTNGADNKLFIDTSGNVGIGTTAPAVKLHVLGTSNEVLRLSKTSSYTAGSGPLIMFTNGPTGEQLATIQGAFHQSSQGNYGNLYFGTRTSDALGVQTKMTILYNGNVGIGTTAPDGVLHIAGTSGQTLLRLSGPSSYGTSTYNYVCFGADNVAALEILWGSNFKSRAGDLHWAYTNGMSFGGAWNSAHILFTSTGSIVSVGDQVISSDASLKTNFGKISYSVADIAACRAVTFDWKDGRGRSAGSIAQDWKPLIPELVHGEEGSMTLAYGQIALINTIIEAREIDALKKRVAELEAEVERLRS